MKKTTEPFKVTCRLADGRINSPDGLLFLDGILYHAWFLKHKPDVFNGIEKSNPDIHYNMGLPLTRLEDGRYAASVGFFHQHSRNIEYWNKRTDFTHAQNSKYSDAKGKVDISAGQFKAYHFPQIIRTVSDIEFYGCGTIEKIKDLLSYIPAVGKKPAAGWGMVKEWVVEPFPEQWHTFGKYGLMRPMPCDVLRSKMNSELLKECSIRYCQLRPPYWKTDKADLCYIPRTLVDYELR